MEPLCLAVGKANAFINTSVKINQDKGPLSQKAKESKFLPQSYLGKNWKLYFKNLIFSGHFMQIAAF